MEKNQIYTITAISGLVEKFNRFGKPYQGRDFLTLGYYFDIEKARGFTLSSGDDIHEDRYMYVAIERLREGVRTKLDKSESVWYVWDDIAGCYTLSEAPSDLEKITKFSME